MRGLPAAGEVQVASAKASAEELGSKSLQSIMKPL